MSRINVLDELTRLGGVHQGTGCLFVSTKTDFEDGAHRTLLDAYVNCEVLIPHGMIMASVAAQLVEPFCEGYIPTFDAVACAAVGDIVFGAMVQSYCCDMLEYDIKFAFVEKTDGEYSFERDGFKEALHGKRVLVLNDRISGGATTTAVIDAVEANGGVVVGVTCVSAPIGMSAESLNVSRFSALCRVDVTPTHVDDASDAMRKLPIALAPGHGFDFMDEGSLWSAGFVRKDTASGEWRTV